MKSLSTSDAETIGNMMAAYGKMRAMRDIYERYNPKHLPAIDKQLAMMEDALDTTIRVAKGLPSRDEGASLDDLPL